MSSLHCALDALETFDGSLLRRHSQHHGFSSFTTASELGGIGMTGMPSLVSRLALSEVLDAHYGCVNTVRWNSSGTLIVSGSDDTNLGIWRISPKCHIPSDCDSTSSQSGCSDSSSSSMGTGHSSRTRLTASEMDGSTDYITRKQREHHRGSQLVTLFNTGHSANIFHALFVPNSGDNEIVSCALDHHVYYNDLRKSSSRRISTNEASCHKLDLIDQFTFLTCSEDGTVRFIDLRDKSTLNDGCNPKRVKNVLLRTMKLAFKAPSFVPCDRTLSSNNSSSRVGVSGGGGSGSSILVSPMMVDRGYISMRPPQLTSRVVAIYTMQLNPLNNYVMALGCRDEWVRLFDRRKLSLTRDGNGERPYCVFTQHCIQHKERRRGGGGYLGYDRQDEGVTGLQWSYDGSEIVCTFSHRAVALFDLYSPRQCNSHFSSTECRRLMKEGKSQRDDEEVDTTLEEVEEEEEDEGQQQQMRDEEEDHRPLESSHNEGTQTEEDREALRLLLSLAGEPQSSEMMAGIMEEERDFESGDSEAGFLSGRSIDVEMTREDERMERMTEGSGIDEREERDSDDDDDDSEHRHRDDTDNEEEEEDDDRMVVDDSKEMEHDDGNEEEQFNTMMDDETADSINAALHSILTGDEEEAVNNLMRDFEENQQQHRQRMQRRERRRHRLIAPQSLATFLEEKDEDDEEEADDMDEDEMDGTSVDDGSSIGRRSRVTDGLSTASGITAVSRAATVGTEKDLALCNAQTKAQIWLEREREQREAALAARHGSGESSVGFSRATSDEEFSVEEVMQRVGPLHGIDEECDTEVELASSISQRAVVGDVARSTGGRSMSSLTTFDEGLTTTSVTSAATMSHRSNGIGSGSTRDSSRFGSRQSAEKRSGSEQSAESTSDHDGSPARKKRRKMSDGGDSSSVQSGALLMESTPGLTDCIVRDDDGSRSHEEVRTIDELSMASEDVKDALDSSSQMRSTINTMSSADILIHTALQQRGDEQRDAMERVVDFLRSTVEEEEDGTDPEEEDGDDEHRRVLEFVDDEQLVIDDDDSGGLPQRSDHHHHHHPHHQHHSFQSQSRPSRSVSVPVGARTWDASVRASQTAHSNRQSGGRYPSSSSSSVHHHHHHPNPSLSQSSSSQISGVPPPLSQATHSSSLIQVDGSTPTGILRPSVVGGGASVAASAGGGGSLSSRPSSIAGDRTPTASHDDCGAHGVYFDASSAASGTRRRMIAPSLIAQRASKATSSVLSELKRRLNGMTSAVNDSVIAKLKQRQSMDEIILVGLEKSEFRGHRTVETVKEVGFMGVRSEYVVSGSDCGHTFIWRKHDGKLMNVLQGDSRICNVVQCSPVNCTLVTSGLDSTVKVFRPIADGCCDESEMESIQRENEDYSDDGNIHGIPPGLIYYLLRRGLISIVSSDDD